MSNKVVVAAAGSGKTALLIDRALSDPTRRVLITTYTIDNALEIEARLSEGTGTLPHHVQVMTWFELLLRHGVKPYQSFVTDIGRIRSVNFATDRPPRVPRSNVNRYYFDSASNLYQDAVSDLTCVIDGRSGGLVINRLENLFDDIFIDELQDLAGYDLEFVDLLFASCVNVTLVGDPRQAIYSTNRSNKNSQYRGAGIQKWIDLRVKHCEVSLLTVSYRCNQLICDFADALYPSHVPTTSGNSVQIEHQGVFLVQASDVEAYVKEFAPQALRWNKTETARGLPVRNFGQSKGLTFPRVLIFATGKMEQYMSTGTALAEGTIPRFYVAATRARHSVAIVVKKRFERSGTIPWWTPSS